ncbi:MAG: hypothetical protein WD801_09260 [Gemmatimonadaceae bacterium]
MTPTKPEDVFRAEKERSLTFRNSQHARLLAEAKAAFDKLMAEGQAARKSGRPRKHPLPPLKTSSSRPPSQPLTAAPAPAVRAEPPKPSAPAKAAKPKPKATVKSGGGARRAARPKGKPAKARKPARSARPAKKVKAKSAKKR